MIAPRARNAIRALVCAAAFCGACAEQPPPGVSMKVVRHTKTPKDAAVTIDDQYIGPLGYVSARGVRLPLGEHHLTVERDGFFPFDKTIVAVQGQKPIHLDVELVPIPD